MRVCFFLHPYYYLLITLVFPVVLIIVAFTFSFLVHSIEAYHSYPDPKSSQNCFCFISLPLVFSAAYLLFLITDIC
jgi:hypothetical protein